MEVKNNKLIFELDSSTIESFKLAVNILNKTPDEAFAEWIRNINIEALKKLNSDSSESSTRVSSSRTYLGDKLDNEVVQSRIKRWARNKDGFAYKMIKILFEYYDSNPEHIVKREDMRKTYTERYLVNKSTASSDIFLVTFRQMCSDSSRAYGLIFKYINDNGRDNVVLHPLNEQLILSLRKEF